ncbi:MAG: hypothetical protein KIT08_01280 [Anaerolineales bacterium]|nr:MAG: hypothetical protein KIT08_01280 [Anaerolineales bacterium]
MATMIASLFAQIGAETRGFKQGMGEVKTGLQQGGKQFDQFGAASLINIAKITGAIYTLKKGFDFAQQGAQMARLETAGANLAAQYGANMDVILSKLRAVSDGTVTSNDLILSSNRAMLLGVTNDADKMAKLLEVAAVRGRAMGLSTTQAFNDIVTGIGRMSPLILDNLGIVTNLSGRVQEWADANGVAADSVDDATKRQILLNAVLEDGNEMLEQTGGLTKDAASGYEYLITQLKEYYNLQAQKAGDALAGPVRQFGDMTKAVVDLDRALQITGAELVRTDYRVRSIVMPTGEIVTYEELLQRANETQRLNNFELERAAFLHAQLRPELEETAASVGQYGAEWQEAASEATAYFDAVNMGLSGQIAREQESIQFGLAGGYELTRTKDQLLEYAKQQIALGKDEGEVWSEYSKNVGLVAQEAIGLQLSLGQIDSKQAQQQLVALGIPVADAAQRAEDLKNGLNLIDGMNSEIGVTITAYGDTWIMRLLDGTFISGGVLPNRPGNQQMGPGGTRGSSGYVNPEMAANGGFLRPGGVFGHATGGRLGSKGPLVKVGEQGWEYAQYDPETGSWEIIPHNKSVQMEQEKAAGMANGGRLIDGVTSASGLISSQRYNSANMTLGGYYMSLGAQHPGAWHQNNPGVDTGWEQNNPNASWLQASAQQAAQQAAAQVAAAAAQAAAVGVGASVAQQGQQQAERAMAAFVAETQRSNSRLEAEVRGMRQDIRNQPSKTDLKNAVLEAMSEAQ